MDSFSIASELTLDDWSAYQRVSAVALRKSADARKVVAVAALAIIVGILVTELFDALGHGFAGPSFFIGVGLAIVLFVGNRRIYYRAALAKQRDSFVGRWEYTVDAAGIRAMRPNRDAFVGWAAISEAVRDGDHVYLWTDNLTAFTVPIRDLPSGVASDAFIAQINVWKSNSTATAVDENVIPSGTVAASIAPLQQATTSSHWRNQIGALARLLTLRSADGASLSGGDGLIASLLLVSLALWALIDLVQAGPDADIYIYNAATFALIVSSLMFISWVLARRTYPRTDFRRVLLVVVAVVPVIILAAVGIELIPTSPWRVLAIVALCGYAILYLLRSLAVLTGSQQTRPVIFAAAIVAVFGMLSSSVYFDTSLWFAPDDESESATTEGSAEIGKQKEALLYEQRDRIDDAIEAIHRPSQTSAAIFFVGFAGVGEQHVFAEEIKLAADVVGKRYKTGDRNVLLINDRRDTDSYPLASTTGLRYALQGVAAKMDVDHDVLFLALSSHGSSKPALSVSNMSLPLNDMSASELASALRESGIKWRIIVISACYAGAFMGRLRDPYTIVIAAAAPDKTSFGCSDDRDLTYFGEAFYRDALPQAASLSEAFDIAKASIAMREAAESVEASDPQAFFGDKIKDKLIELHYDGDERAPEVVKGGRR